MKERDAERERNITKKIQEYEQKYDFINKAPLERVAQITEIPSLITQQQQLGLNWQTRWSCYHHCLMALSQR